LSIKNPEGLLGIGFCIFADLLNTPVCPSSISITSVTNQRSERTYNDYRIVAEILELPQFSHWYRVSEVQIRAGYIVATVNL
jgi:hypothetical protein